MGEVAEMMLNGTFCGQCGVFLGHPEGLPLFCSNQCAVDAGATADRVRKPFWPMEDPTDGNG